MIKVQHRESVEIKLKATILWYWVLRQLFCSLFLFFFFVVVLCYFGFIRFCKLSTK